jgi:hypothetical protein
VRRAARTSVSNRAGPLDIEIGALDVALEKIAAPGAAAGAWSISDTQTLARRAVHFKRGRRRTEVNPRARAASGASH